MESNEISSFRHHSRKLIDLKYRSKTFQHYAYLAKALLLTLLSVSCYLLSINSHPHRIRQRPHKRNQVPLLFFSKIKSVGGQRLVRQSETETYPPTSIIK